MIDKYAPSCTNLFPVSIKVQADILYNFRAAFQYANDIAEWLPPILEVILSCIIWNAIELEAERFDFLLPTSQGNHEFTLCRELHDTRVLAE